MSPSTNTQTDDSTTNSTAASMQCAASGTLVLDVAPSLARHGAAHVAALVAEEIARGRAGRVIAVVSPDRASVARIRRGLPNTGDATREATLLSNEAASLAGQVADALEAMGVSAAALTRPVERSLGRGHPLAASPRAIPATRIDAALRTNRVAVIAGPAAHGDDGEPLWLGEDGGELTATLIGSAMGFRVRLLRGGTAPELRRLGIDDVLSCGAPALVSRRTALAARHRSQRFELAWPAENATTTVWDGPSLGRTATETPGTAAARRRADGVLAEILDRPERTNCGNDLERVAS